MTDPTLIEAAQAERDRRGETFPANPTNMRGNSRSLTDVVTGVVAEVERATAKFPTWPTDIIHAGNVVSEESGELAKAILQAVYEPHKSGIDDVREEAEQTAAMAIRFLMSLDRYELTPSIQHEQVQA